MAVCLRCVLLLQVVFLIESRALPQASSENARFQLYEEAQRAMARDDYDRAIVVYKQLIRVDGKSAPLFLQLGIAQYQKGDFASAATALRRALELEPNMPAAEAFLGLSEAGLGHPHLSIPMIEKSLASRDPAVDQDLRRLLRLRLGKLYSDVGRFNEAEMVYMSLLKDYPDDQQVLYENFWLHMTSGREIMKTLLRKAPNSHYTHQMLGYLLGERGSYLAAAEQFRLALKDNPAGLGLHYELGWMLWCQSPDMKDATTEYEEELRLHPSHVLSYIRLAELAERNSQLDRAWELYKKALEFDPNNSDAMVGLCKICMSRNQTPEALVYCEKAVKVDPANRAGHYQLARVYRALGRTTDANVQMSLFEKLQIEDSKESQYLSSARVASSMEQ